MSRLARLALGTTVLTFLLAAAGGLVRATGSGLGCPGWPRCFGRWVPPFEHHAIIEMTHRYLASGVSVGVIATAAVAVLFHRRDRVTLGLGLAIVPLVFAQALLGAYVVHRELTAWTVVAHLGLGMAFAATLIALTVHLSVPRRGDGQRSAQRLLGATAAVVYVQLLLGSWVTGRSAGLVFTDWPLYGGRVLPRHLGREPAFLHFGHRSLAYLVAALVVAAAVRARRVYGASSGVARISVFAVVLTGVQIALGVANLRSHLNPAVVTAHLAAATLIWGSTFAAWCLGRLAAAVPPAPQVPVPSDVSSETEAVPVRKKVLAYVSLTKPRIIELLLVTTLPTMVVAAKGIPSVGLMVATLVGGALAAGGANAINMFVDRDIDAVMKRTANRPLVTGVVTPRAALTFAIALEIAAAAELAVLVNVLSAVLAVSATLFYVFVYTLWLKRTSTQNIVIGGAAGAVPVLVGWAAVRNGLGVAPLVLFAIIFVWTPPHFWALAIKYRDDYAAAKVPMLPAVASFARTARQIVAYTAVLWAISLVFAGAGGMGLIYIGAAVVLGAVFLAFAIQLWRDESEARAMRLFSYSISYVTLLFSAMALDALVHVR